MSPPSSPTMQQIADAAGVSRMAVSLALRNSPKISKPTADRIRRFADELGYRPNPMISALMSQLRHARDLKKPSVIAYLTSHSTENGWRRPGPFIPFFEGARRRAAELGYVLEEWWLNRPGMTRERLCEILHTRDIHGLVVAPLPPGDGMLELDWSRFAMSTIAYSLHSPPMSRASNDHLSSIDLALRELTTLGYRRIGLVVAEESDARAQRQWIAGMAGYQQQIHEDERVPTLCATNGLAHLFREWVHEHEPQAVISISSQCLRLLGELGYRVPQDIGFAHLALGPEDRDCAGVNPHPELIGAAAVDLVDAQLRRNERGVPPVAKTLLLPGEWVAGPTVRDQNAQPKRARVRVG